MPDQDFDILTDAPDSVWQCQQCRYLMTDIAWQSMRVRTCPRCQEPLYMFWRFKNMTALAMSYSVHKKGTDPQ